MESLKNRVAVVAGGAGAVGEGIVRSLLAGGASVVVPARSAERLDALRQRIPEAHRPRLDGRVVELTNLNEAIQLRDALLTQYGQLDLLVAALGGWQQGKTLYELDLSTFEQLIANNLMSHLLFIRTFVPVLVSQQNGSAYVHINGSAAEAVIPGAGLVSMLAAAQLSMAQTLAAELRGLLVRAYELVLGPVNTRHQATHHPQWYTAEEVGEYVAGLYLQTAPRPHEVVHRLLSKPLNE